MKIVRTMAVLAALVLLAPRPAVATEQPLPPTQNITAVSPSASPVAAGTLETITISGVGKCGTFLLDLGDVTPTVHLPGNSRFMSIMPTRSPGLVAPELLRVFPWVAQGDAYNRVERILTGLV